MEAGADEISEEDMLSAMAFGPEAIVAFCEEHSSHYNGKRTVLSLSAASTSLTSQSLRFTTASLLSRYELDERVLRDAGQAVLYAEAAGT